MAHAPSDQSLLKMMSSPYTKKKRNNYSSGGADGSITKIQIGEISQAKAVRKYGIPIRSLAWKCKSKRENMTENSPGPIPVLGEATEKDLVQWALAMQKQGLPVGRDMIIQKASKIHRYMFCSIRSVGLVGHRWCEQFMSRQREVTLNGPSHHARRNEASLEGLREFFYGL